MNFKLFAKFTFVFLTAMADAMANETTVATDSSSILQLPGSDHKRPKFISVKYDQGKSLKTNDYLKKEGTELGYRAISAKFGFSQYGDSWEYIDAHKGYDGIGIYIANFDDKANGDPFSIFLFHGGDLAEFNQRLHLQYEWNLGYSFNWGHYDAFNNPEDITMGASESFHIGANIFLQWQPCRNFDLRVGGGLTHFSNGASHLPNKGMNLISPMVELRYRMDDPSYTLGHESSREIRDMYGIHKPSLFHKHFKNEFTFTFSRRQKYMSTKGGLPNEYYDHAFRVFGLAYAPMRCPSSKYAYGPSLDIVYDESNNSKVNREINESDGQVYDHLYLGDTKDRFQLGVSLKGEINMKYFSYFANLGYDLIHADEKTARFYQIMGIQFRPSKHVFGTMGIRAINFSKAQFVYWSLGYVLRSRKDEKAIAEVEDEIRHSSTSNR